ncbi:PecA family PE domain-processing aspartic protease [Mycolicibacterium sphagni]|uniref:PecA family PE domain-processing aspartic protease n=1 Tax=Mycolicibacterium sphagni TaxID=1786 RepID=UPI0013FD18DE|nr:PecA family PE domain-processing aspartic protease [Mycolicibacterium sphagni]
MDLRTGRQRGNTPGEQDHCKRQPVVFGGWLAAGAIALGLGAALATGCGTAQADTATSGSTGSAGAHQSHSGLASDRRTTANSPLGARPVSAAAATAVHRQINPVKRPAAGMKPAAVSASQHGATVVPAAQESATSSASVPLHIYSDTEPLVDVSIGGGPAKPVLVDTGSKGLVVGLGNIGLLRLFSMGLPTGLGVSAYSGGLTYLYATFKTTVNFGNGIVTKPTSVDVALLSYPGSFESFAAGNGATGILGIGPNATGPGPSSVISALPGDLSDGVLIDEPDGVLVFGPNPKIARASVSGAPNAQLQVKVGNGSLQSVSAIIDSGGVYGTVPSSIAPNVPIGTVIWVYSADGQTVLYTYTTDATNTPTVTSDYLLNTGYEAFVQQPVYISYSPTGVGTTIFDYL